MVTGRKINRRFEMARKKEMIDGERRDIN